MQILSLFDLLGLGVPPPFAATGTPSANAPPGAVSFDALLAQALANGTADLTDAQVRDLSRMLAVFTPGQTVQTLTLEDAPAPVKLDDTVDPPPEGSPEAAMLADLQALLALLTDPSTPASTLAPTVTPESVRAVIARRFGLDPATSGHGSTPDGPPTATPDATPASAAASPVPAGGAGAQTSGPGTVPAVEVPQPALQVAAGSPPAAPATEGAAVPEVPPVKPPPAPTPTPGPTGASAASASGAAAAAAEAPTKTPATPPAPVTPPVADGAPGQRPAPTAPQSATPLGPGDAHPVQSGRDVAQPAPAPPQTASAVRVVVAPARGEGTPVIATVAPPVAPPAEAVQPATSDAPSRGIERAELPRGSDAVPAPSAPAPPTTQTADALAARLADLRDARTAILPAQAGQTGADAHAQGDGRQATGSDGAQATLHGAALGTRGLTFVSLHDAGGRPLPVPTTVPELPEQVVRTATFLAREHGGIMQLHLKPEALGDVTVRVIQEHELIKIDLTAQSHQVRDVLQGQLPHLKQQLADQGLALGGLSVSVEAGGGQAPGDSDPHPQPHGRSGGQAPVTAATAPGGAPVALPAMAGTSGLDLMA